MLIYQLVVLPTPETVQYLSNVFSGSPIDLDLQSFFVEINSSTEIMEADESRVYKATAGSLGRYYDSNTEETSLLLPLVSESLLARCRELREHAPSQFYGDHYFPYMCIKRNMPPMKAHRRGLINSWADTLYANHFPLMFDAEIVLHKELDNAPDLDYYTTRVVDAAD
jgi:hypothetical protein